MRTIAGLLSQSASVRPSVQQAIDGVESCSVSPSNGEVSLQQAVSTRQNIMSQLQSVDTGALTDGSSLMSDLSSALQNSVTADGDYISWMEDFAADNYQCGSDPTQDSEYNAGQSASQQATSDKNAFVSLWNPQAAQYGEQTYTSTDF